MLLDGEKVKELTANNESLEKLVVVDKLSKFFPVRSGFLGETKYVNAVEDVSFSIGQKQTLGLIGESGCGKTTTATIILRLLEPTNGDVTFNGQSIFAFNKKELKKYRRKVQLIFQDPYSSLNPVHDVWNQLNRPFTIHKLTDSSEELLDKVSSLLETVGLTPINDYIHKYPHELSGGERQRIGIAKALAVNPIFIVADEPVSMLDMSLRADILKLMMQLKEERNLTYLYITHDLASARYFCDSIAVMYLGEIVEMGETEEVILKPKHPYTNLLLSAVPVPDPKLVIKRLEIKGGIPDPTDLPRGCRFHPRCTYAKAICKEKKPQLLETDTNHYVRCVLFKS